MTLYGRRNGLRDAGRGAATTRLGISVGRRFGRAVYRNRIKRRIREAFRRVRHDLPAGLDLVVVPRPGSLPEVSRLEESLRQLANRLAARLEPDSGPSRDRIPTVPRS